jgi:hypothetical protein
MIQIFKHKGLKRLFESGISSGVNPQHSTRIRKILALLETAETIEDMVCPVSDCTNSEVIVKELGRLKPAEIGALPYDSKRGYI